MKFFLFASVLALITACGGVSNTDQSFVVEANGVQIKGTRKPGATVSTKEAKMAALLVLGAK